MWLNIVTRHVPQTHFRNLKNVSYQLYGLENISQDFFLFVWRIIGINLVSERLELWNLKLLDFREKNVCPHIKTRNFYTHDCTWKKIDKMKPATFATSMKYFMGLIGGRNTGSHYSD